MTCSRQRTLARRPNLSPAPDPQTPGAPKRPGQRPSRQPARRPDRAAKGRGTLGLEATGVNHYGARAQEHWRRHLPRQLAKIPDPEEFFTLLGETAESEIADRAEALAKLKPPADGYLDEVARLETARKLA